MQMHIRMYTCMSRPVRAGTDALHFQPIRVGDLLLFDGAFWHGAAVEHAAPLEGPRISISFNLGWGADGGAPAMNQRRRVGGVWRHGGMALQRTSAF